jgi:Domain of unknown function (DUF4279)
MTDSGGIPWPESIRRTAEWMPAAGERPEGVYVTVGGNVDRIALGLRVIGPGLDPDRISELLGCAPSGSHKAGDPVSKDGRGRRSEGSWRLKSTLPESAALDDHLSNVLDRVSSDLAVWRELTNRYRADVFCGLFLDSFNRGTALSASSCKALADRGLTVSFDIYGCVEK